MFHFQGPYFRFVFLGMSQRWHKNNCQIKAYEKSKDAQHIKVWHEDLLNKVKKELIIKVM